MTTNNTFLRDDAQFVGASSGGPRYVLTTATTFYVATNGNDSNDGLTSGTPWLTFAHAMAVLTRQVDFGGQAVTLQAVAGHAAFTTILNIMPWTGGGSFTFDGGAGSITVACTALAGNCIATIGDLPSPVTVQNVTLITTGTADTVNHTTGNGIYHAGVGRVVIGSGVTFASCVGHHMMASEPGSKFFGTAGYSITGSPGDTSHIQLFAYSQAFMGGLITGGAGLSWPVAFVFAVGAADYSNAIFSGFSGVAGSRYLAIANGVINSGGKGANFFPGSVAGSASLGGQYL